MLARLAFALLVANSLVRATANAPEQGVAKHLWYHEEGHPVHSLFRREDADDDDADADDSDDSQSKDAHKHSTGSPGPVSATTVLPAATGPAVGSAGMLSFCLSMFIPNAALSQSGWQNTRPMRDR